MYEDQDFLHSRINQLSKQPLTIDGLKALNKQFGYGPVLGAMRCLWGFPPEELRNPYGYIQAVCRDQL